MNDLDYVIQYLEENGIDNLEEYLHRYYGGDYELFLQVMYDHNY